MIKMGHYVYLWCRNHNEYIHIGKLHSESISVEVESVVLFRFFMRHLHEDVYFLLDHEDEFSKMCEGTEYPDEAKK